MFALTLFAWARPARADAQFATTVYGAGGWRLVSQTSSYYFGTLGFWTDVLFGPRDPHWNAPRFGPFVTVRRDFGNTHSTGSVAAGLSFLLIGRRGIDHPFTRVSATLAFGGFAGSERTGNGPDTARYGALLRVWVGHRTSQPWAMFIVGLFAEYRYVLDPVQGQHDVIVGLEISPFALGGAGTHARVPSLAH